VKHCGNENKCFSVDKKKILAVVGCVPLLAWIRRAPTRVDALGALHCLNRRKQSATRRRPTATRRRPTATRRRPTATRRRPTATRRRPTATRRRPTATPQTATLCLKTRPNLTHAGALLVFRRCEAKKTSCLKQRPRLRAKCSPSTSRRRAWTPLAAS